MNSKPYDPNAALYQGNMYSDMPMPGNVATGQPVYDQQPGMAPQYPSVQNPPNPNYGQPMVETRHPQMASMPSNITDKIGRQPTMAQC